MIILTLAGHHGYPLILTQTKSSGLYSFTSTLGASFDFGGLPGFLPTMIKK